MSIQLRIGRRMFALIFAIICVATLCVGITLSRLKSSSGPAIKIFRDTQALELVRMESTSRGNLLLVFKNVSSRDVNGFVLAIQNGPEMSVDLSIANRVIAPAQTTDLEIPASSQVPEITLRAVMFADGDVEGNETTLSQVKHRRGALKRELRQGLVLIKNAVDSSLVNSPAIFENLETAISNLQIDPSLPQSAQGTGLIETKQDLISAIREVRTRQERNRNKTPRERLQELCDQIEQRIATL